MNTADPKYRISSPHSRFGQSIHLEEISRLDYRLKSTPFVKSCPLDVSKGGDPVILKKVSVSGSDPDNFSIFKSICLNKSHFLALNPHFGGQNQVCKRSLILGTLSPACSRYFPRHCSCPSFSFASPAKTSLRTAPQQSISTPKYGVLRQSVLPF